MLSDEIIFFIKANAKRWNHFFHYLVHQIQALNRLINFIVGALAGKESPNLRVKTCCGLLPVNIICLIFLKGIWILIGELRSRVWDHEIYLRNSDCLYYVGAIQALENRISVIRK